MVARVRDVALAAGVSAAAVSRYLNGKLVLSAETAARIDAAVSTLRYQANPHARRLSLGRSDMIGFVVPDIANPFFALLADAIQQQAELDGFGLLITATRNRLEQELAALDRLAREGAAGMLFVTNHADDGRLAEALRGEFPVVLLDEDVAGAVGPKLFVDNVAGGRLAARCLVAAGHRRVAVLGGPRGLLSSVERHGGFRAEIEATGGSVVWEDFGDYTSAAGRIAADRMLALSPRPTAAFATSEQTLFGLLDAARICGIRVPDDLSVVGFDDIGPLHLTDPPLTAVRQPVEELGRQGVLLLLEAMRGGRPAMPARLKVELIERGSVAPPRTEEE